MDQKLPTYTFFLNGNSQKSYLAVGCKNKLILNDEIGAFEQAKKFISDHNKAYVFGWFGYDLKNDTENLTSSNIDNIQFPDLLLVIPEHIAEIDGHEFNIIEGDETLLKDTFASLSSEENTGSTAAVAKSTLTQQEYLDKIRLIQDHIQLGDIYEANFCYEYIASEALINPISVYSKLNNLTKAPFSTFVKADDLFVLGASPERFIKKEGNKVTSQPIKGTIKRSRNPLEDQSLIEELKNSKKDRSENVMIVDLVRNDLSKIAVPKSVKVEELCEIYTFENIHQMISTVSANVAHQHPVDIIKSLFPMGSMTGAPKVRAMELMENYEISKRGLYSGCIGYFKPNGDFDFNVVIRTILYNQTNNNLSFSVGGAITALSSPEGEYEETILKASAMKTAISE